MQFCEITQSHNKLLGHGKPISVHCIFGLISSRYLLQYTFFLQLVSHFWNNLKNDISRCFSVYSNFYFKFTSAFPCHVYLATKDTSMRRTRTGGRRSTRCVQRRSLRSRRAWSVCGSCWSLGRIPTWEPRRSTANMWVELQCIALA